MERLTNHPVRDLLAEPATRELIVDDEDYRRLKILTNLCQEFSYHGKNVLDEPSLLFELARDDTAQKYRLWFLYPPAVRGLCFQQLSTVFGYGHPYVRSDEIVWEMEATESPPRVALVVHVAMSSSAVIAETKETLIVSTTVVHHAVNSGSLVGADAPGGLAARRLLKGVTLDNRTAGRPAPAPAPATERRRLFSAFADGDGDAEVPPEKRRRSDLPQ